MCVSKLKQGITQPPTLIALSCIPPPATGETGKVEKKAGQKIFQINSPSWCVTLCKTHQLTSRWGKAVPNWRNFRRFFERPFLSSVWAIFPFQLFERRTKGAFYLVSLTQGVSLMITTITLWWYFQRSCLESSVHQRSSTWRCYRSAAPSSRECKSQVFYKYIFACKLCALKFSNTISTFKSAKKSIQIPGDLLLFVQFYARHYFQAEAR